MRRRRIGPMGPRGGDPGRRGRSHAPPRPRQGNGGSEAAGRGRVEPVGGSPSGCRHPAFPVGGCTRWQPARSLRTGSAWTTRRPGRRWSAENRDRDRQPAGAAGPRFAALLQATARQRSSMLRPGPRDAATSPPAPPRSDVQVHGKGGGDRGDTGGVDRPGEEVRPSVPGRRRGIRQPPEQARRGGSAPRRGNRRSTLLGKWSSHRSTIAG